MHAQETWAPEFPESSMPGIIKHPAISGKGVFFQTFRQPAITRMHDAFERV